MGFVESANTLLKLLIESEAGIANESLFDKESAVFNESATWLAVAFPVN